MKDKLRKLLLIVPVVGFLFLVPLLTLISKIPGGPPDADGVLFRVGKPHHGGLSPADGQRLLGRFLFCRLGNGPLRPVLWPGLLAESPYPVCHAAPQRFGQRCGHYRGDAAAPADGHRLQRPGPGRGGTGHGPGAWRRCGTRWRITAARSSMWAYRNSGPSWNSAIQTGRPPTASTAKRCGKPLCRPWRAEQVPFLEMKPLLEGREDLTDLYSTVDHHYTLLGAYETYLARL